MTHDNDRGVFFSLMKRFQYNTDDMKAFARRFAISCGAYVVFDEREDMQEPWDFWTKMMLVKIWP